MGKNRYRFGFEKLLRWIRLCREEGMVYFEISHLFSQWGAVAAPKIMGEKEGRLQRLFGWETEASGEEYRLFLQAFLRELKEVLRKEGVLEQTYFHISDEPNLEQLSSYRAALDGVKEVLKDCKRMDALSDYHFFEEGLVPIPVCATDRLEPFLQKRPKELWCYYCTSQGEKVSNRFIAMPGYRTRVLGAQLYKERLDGFLHWGYNFYNSQYSLHPVNPYLCTDAGGAFPSGDPFIVYPGAEKEPEESIRIRLLDEAFSDFCAMKLLEQLTDRETVLACMDPEGALGIADYPKSAAAVESERCAQKTPSADTIRKPEWRSPNAAAGRNTAATEKYCRGRQKRCRDNRSCCRRPLVERNPLRYTVTDFKADRNGLEKMNTKNLVKRMAGAVVGTLLFAVVTQIEISSPVANTYLQPRMGILAVVSAVGGPLIGAICGFVGHLLGDYWFQQREVWLSWALAEAIVGVGIGFFRQKFDVLGKGFHTRQGLLFEAVQVGANALAWLAVAPLLDMVFYGQRAEKVFLQGGEAFLLNAVITGVLGLLLLAAFSQCYLRLRRFRG